MAYKRRNEDELLNDITKRFHLDDIRNSLQTEGSYNTNNNSSSSSNANFNIPTANTSSYNNIQIINHELEKIMNYYGSLPSGLVQLNEDDLVNFIIIRVKQNNVLRELFQIQESNIISIIRRKIRSGGFFNSSSFSTLRTNVGLRRDDTSSRELFQTKKTNATSSINRNIRSRGASSSNINYNSNISPTNTLNLDDLKTFWNNVFLILQDYVDNYFQKIQHERFKRGLVDRVVIHLRQKTNSMESFRLDGIDITDSFRILSCVTKNGDTLSHSDLETFVNNVIRIINDLKSLGWLDNPSDPLSVIFQNFLEKAKHHLSYQ